MKQLALLLVLGLSLHRCLGTANQVTDLGVGTITLLSGYTHQAMRGTDSTPGTITRADGKFVLRYDIGQMAGSQMYPARKPACSWYQEQSINGHKACLGIFEDEDKGVTYLSATIYSSPTAATGEPANFNAEIKSRDEVADALLMISTYQTKAKE